MQYHLVVTGELPEPVREFLIEQPEFLIGRGADCDLRLSDTTISRHHCILRTTGDELFLVDLGSSNGTYLNGQRVRSQALVRDGDKVAAGANTFLIRFGAVTPTPTDDPGARTQRPGTLPRT